MYVSKLQIHSYYVRGAVSPKPNVADYVPAVRRTYVQKIVETRVHATEVESFATRMQFLDILDFCRITHS